MTPFRAYVAGPVLRPALADGRQFPVATLYDKLGATAGALGVQITLPVYSERLDRLSAPAFAEEIRKRIRKADAMIAVIIRPENMYDLSAYSIAVEAHEAALAGKPIAFLAESQDLVPRLVAALDDRNQKYAFADLETLDSVFEDLAKEIERRAR